MVDFTPLSIAVELASFDIIKLMFDCNRSIEHGQLLHRAARREEADRLDVMRFALSKGAHIDHIMYQSKVMSYQMRALLGLGTALHEAARLGRVDLIELLAAEGANPLIEDTFGWTPLGRTISRESFSCRGSRQTLGSS